MLTIEQIEKVCAFAKEDWQRKVNQGVLKQALGASSLSISESVQALGAMEAIDQLLYSLRTEDQRQEIAESRALHAHGKGNKRIRPIFIPKVIRGKEGK